MPKPEDEQVGEDDARNHRYRIAHEGPASFKLLGENCHALGERVGGEALTGVRQLKTRLPGEKADANGGGGMFGQVENARNKLMPYLKASVDQLEKDAGAAEKQLYDLLGKVITVSDKYDDVEKNNKTNVTKALADLQTQAQDNPARPA